HSAKRVVSEKPRDVGGLRARVVDDSGASRTILQEELACVGVSSEAAESGERALELPRAVRRAPARFDLVFIDLDMPGMSGSELARRIARDRLVGGLPVVGLLTMAQRRRTDFIEASDFAACLTKPVRQAQLHACLKDLLAHGRGRAPAIHPSGDGLAARIAARGAAPTRVLLV